ncbi:MAG: phosphate--acyl-ACP acyltransferase [Candidatus Cloacimonetes bacterium 4572_65]|nr:MAG: phosphate--acyl-ACP acyltransferase [Candidatus Cloacimonetes bacterium 4572_65]
MRIALDAFGSDNAPFPEVEGAVLAIKENFCEKVFLVGDKEILDAELSKYYYDKDRIEVVHASERILMTDVAVVAARKKKDSSMVKALRLHKDGVVDGVVSAGNSGAMMASSLFTLGRIKNVSRPAIAMVFPTTKSNEIILDVGANVDCAPEHLVQFAELGNMYSQFINEIDNPRISLLNIGEEDKKGNELTKEVYRQLSSRKDLNFIGNIEGKDVLKGITDVIICDGFTGNIMLKTVEGAAIAIFDILKEQFAKDWIAKIGALLSIPVFNYLKKKLDHSEYGGALLIGLKGIPIVSHGRSNSKAIKNAIKLASKLAKTDFIQRSSDFFERKK